MGKTAAFIATIAQFFGRVLAAIVESGWKKSARLKSGEELVPDSNSVFRAAELLIVLIFIDQGTRKAMTTGTRFAMESDLLHCWNKAVGWAE